jgi:lipoyl(octanoyl) transferase
MSRVIFEDLGLIDYKEAWDLQESSLLRVIESRANPDRRFSYLYFCEHPHVYTLGKSGTEQNLLINEEFLKKIDACYYKINRGGDITYHGPGQLVGYPIFDLDQFGIQVKRYVHLLEEAIIQSMDHFGIPCGRLEGATGAWLDVDVPARTRKICAIGVRVSRFVSMHGFALNVNTNLNYFNYINPCGFVDKGVTSMEKELGRPMDFNLVKQVLREKINTVFGFQYETESVKTLP